MIRFTLRAVLIFCLALILGLAAFRLSAALRESGTVSAPAEGSFVQTASGSIYMQAAGPADGVPVMLAHGTAAWSGFWSREIELLGDAGFAAMAFDMPPFGFSDRASDGDYSRPRQAQRILDLVAATGTKPIMVAHSFGAAAATEAVLRDPTAFRALIIVNGALGMTDDPQSANLPLPFRPMVIREALVSATATNPLVTKMLLRSMLHQKDAATDAYADILKRPQRRPGTTTAYAQWLPSLMAPTPDALSRDAARYADLPIPVHVIWGDRDTVTPPDQAESLAAALGQGPVHYLTDVGHIPHIEAPDAFATLLLDLLTRID